ncbi:RNA-binding protein 39 isoform X2 [Gossypium hirsutum]|uniref:RNA-binding protein 39 isoform X2 n=1 Tax=Gossypium hirsutum TaxID=3635 RepID=A0ABM3C0A1_GOSHI|nr:RNA-binding protein 39-like isoform X2 [Gossypium hirsutum]
MDFDEYEYLENTVENPEPQKAKKENGNGSVDTVKSEERNRSRSSKHKRDERADGSDDYHHPSKHSKSREESSRDHDQRKELGLSQLSRSRDGEKDRQRSSREHRSKDRDREDRNGREREKERDRDRKERDRESERDRERERERERSRRSRSRSEREPDKSRDMEFREREKEREPRERDRGSRFARAIFRWSFWQLGQALDLRRYKDKKEDAAEAEVDPERDQRTVFAYQISLKASERDVYEFFSRAGKVRDVRLIMDRNSRRSKGVGYIEFYDVMSVPMAIALSGQPLIGQPVMVKPSEAEKNLVQSTTSASAGQTGPYAAGGRKLYVGNLHFNITEDQLRQVFEPFGSVELVQLPLDETGHSKGFGFVQFARLEDAKNALNLNGQLEIGGRVIKVSTVTDQGVSQDFGTNATAADLDDDDGGGLSLNSSSRALLMAKLDRSGTASSIAGSVGMPANNSTGLTASTAPILGVAPSLPSLVPPTIPTSISTIPGLPGGLQLPTNGIPAIDTIGSPSECLLLKNMFDPTLETEPEFDLDIKEDVQEECSKFGKLKHIHVDRDSAGFVYLRFEDAQGAINAQRNLHGRWFAGKMITATYMVPQTYEAKFPSSKR